MGVSIGTLSLKFTANVGGLVSGLAQAAGSINGFTARVQRLQGIATSFIDWFGSAPRAMREGLVDAASLGAQVESLNDLRVGFRRAGGSAQDLEGALVHMSRLQGEVAAGNLLAARTYQVLGLDARRAASQSTVEAFGQV